MPYNLKAKCKLGLRVLMAIFYMVAGLNHFLNPAIYMKIMPPYLPFPLALVYISGFFEAFFGLLLLVPRFAKTAAWGLIALLIAVFPANIHMVLHPGITPEIPYPLLLVRLPLQVLLILWAYWFTTDSCPKSNHLTGELMP